MSTVTCAVEGLLDEVVLRRLALELGVNLGLVYGRKGKHYLDAKLAGYNQAACFSPWLVLRNMDRDGECPVSLRDHLLPAPAPNICFRLAVRSVESWLLADPDSLARFFGISAAHLPANPEDLDNPKTALVNLARRSRRSAISEDIVPREGSGRNEGPGYSTRMSEFVDRHWQPSSASAKAESLDRTIRCLRSLGTA